MSSPDRQAILNEYFKNSGLSRKRASEAIKSYDKSRKSASKATKSNDNYRRVMTECAKVVGSRPYYVGDRIKHKATRGSRI